MTLGKFTDESFSIGLYTCRVWDGNGSWNHLELRVFTGDDNCVYWKKWEYDTISLTGVKVAAATHLFMLYKEWMLEAERMAALVC